MASTYGMVQAMAGHEEPPLTAREKDQATRIVIRFIASVAAGYLAFQLAHESELLPRFLDFEVFESPWWRFALILCIAGYIAAGGKKRRDTTPNP